MVGIVVSFWDGLFLGATGMLVSVLLKNFDPRSNEPALNPPSLVDRVAAMEAGHGWWEVWEAEASFTSNDVSKNRGKTPPKWMVYNGKPY